MIFFVFFFALFFEFCSIFFLQYLFLSFFLSFLPSRSSRQQIYHLYATVTPLFCPFPPSYIPLSMKNADWLDSPWNNFFADNKAEREQLLASQLTPTGVEESDIAHILAKFATKPEDFNAHRGIQRILKVRRGKGCSCLWRAYVLMSYACQMYTYA